MVFHDQLMSGVVDLQVPGESGQNRPQRAPHDQPLRYPIVERGALMFICLFIETLCGIVMQMLLDPARHACTD